MTVYLPRNGVTYFYDFRYRGVRYLKSSGQTKKHLAKQVTSPPASGNGDPYMVVRGRISWNSAEFLPFGKVFSDVTPVVQPALSGTQYTLELLDRSYSQRAGNVEKWGAQNRFVLSMVRDEEDGELARSILENEGVDRMLSEAADVISVVLEQVRVELWRQGVTSTLKPELPPDDVFEVDMDLYNRPDIPPGVILRSILNLDEEGASTL